MAPLAPHRYHIWLTAALVAAALGYGAYVVLAGRLGGSAADAPRLTAGYAGTAACVACHADLADDHAVTPHALALRPAREYAAASALPEPRWIPDPQTNLSYRI